MYNIGITLFSPSPWNKRVRDVMFNALSNNKNINCEKISNYPEKKYDILILCGIRVISKQKLEINKLRKNAKILIEIGDDGLDSQTSYEDYYFYFIPVKNPRYEHYIHIPKFVDENYLYPEQTNKVSVFVDHFKTQTEFEREISIKSLLYIFEKLKKYKNEIDLYFHSSKGVELNPENITIPGNKKSDFKFIDYEEITKIYRKCHIFFPTHRETQGMLAQEIGACGGITIMQEWMYPKETHHQFEHELYSFKQFVDFESILKICRTKNFIKKNRDTVIKNCSVSLFNKTFREKIFGILNKHFK